MLKTWFFFSLFQLAVVGGSFYQCLAAQQQVVRHPELATSQFGAACSQRLRSRIAAGLALLSAVYTWQQHQPWYLTYLYVAIAIMILIIAELYGWYASWLRAFLARPRQYPPQPESR